MCIIFISSVQNINCGYRLIIASNRDEDYNRPTLPANYWSEDNNIIGGRDLMPSSCGGTWLALNIKGKFAALLNVSELDDRPNAQSRGQLVENFVKGDTTALEYLQGLPDVYNGFKLITINMSKSFLETNVFTNVVNNEGPAIVNIPNGVQGFGNGPYLKVTEGEICFKNIVKKYGHNRTRDTLIQELLSLLKWDKLHYPDEELIKQNQKHSHADNPKQLSSIFVKIPNKHYGTRTHTIILIDHDGIIEFNEWTICNSNWEHQCFTTTLKCEK